MTLEADIFILIILIVLSGFFSGSETAFFSLSKLRVEHLAEKKKKGIETVKKLKEKPHSLLITLLIGNNLVNVGSSALATKISLDFFQNSGIGIAIGVMTFLILTFGEIIPKNFALNHNVRFSIIAAKPIYFLLIVFFPIIKFYDLFLRKSNKYSKGPIVTEEEIKSYVKAGHKAGEIKKQEREMISKIFQFDDVAVKEIMTPKPDIFLLNSEDKLQDHIKDFIKKPYSRIPVYFKNKDNIIGVLYIKEILKKIVDKRVNRKLKNFVKPVLFVPETRMIDSLLKDFQLKNQHMAIVVDEHGIVSGLITLEDILEQIVGDIQDEVDIDKPGIEKINYKKWKISGKVNIHEVNEKLKTRIKNTDDYDTFGGYVLHKIGRVPKTGEIIKIYNHKIKINRKAGQRILDTTVWKIK
ncbi:MAG: hemolysin family protein [Nanoarchaeota archaeon]